MNRRFILWTTMIAAIFLLINGTAWADGKRGNGPGKGHSQGYHHAPQKPGGHNHTGGHNGPSHFKGAPHQFHRPPSPAHHKGKGHGRPYVSPYRHHHRHAPAPPPRRHYRPAPPPPHHHHRPAPPVVYYRPAPPQPIGGYTISATVSDPGFAFGFSFGESW